MKGLEKCPDWECGGNTARSNETFQPKAMVDLVWIFIQTN